MSKIKQTEENQKDTFTENIMPIERSKVWNEKNPSQEGGYICRMTNSCIKMCYWDGVKWKDMWKETLSGEVRLWTDIPNENDLSVLSVKQAMDILCNKLKDESYYISWKANIAMAFKDEVWNTNAVKDLFTEDMIYEIANNASDNFLKLLMK
jgi:hypothetical protein